MADLDEIRKFGVEPDTEHYRYDPNACAWCGQPVLVVESKERIAGYRSEKISCEYCMSKMAKRTRAKEFRWVFLPGWKPEA